jgi:hypothetical protein
VAGDERVDGQSRARGRGADERGPPAKERSDAKEKGRARLTGGAGLTAREKGRAHARRMGRTGPRAGERHGRAGERGT